eukprot:gb/GECG01014991.1/.p1 GENE.gb/GECG01014991.1/~~gb/GECG01014991.1/.p1  ORF type:complete len:1759 (+),score=440.15 gb/GECG01014991.1/:1-5277(+)
MEGVEAQERETTSGEDPSWTRESSSSSALSGAMTTPKSSFREKETSDVRDNTGDEGNKCLTTDPQSEKRRQRGSERAPEEEEDEVARQLESTQDNSPSDNQRFGARRTTSSDQEEDDNPASADDDNVREDGESARTRNQTSTDEAQIFTQEMEEKHGCTDDTHAENQGEDNSRDNFGGGENSVVEEMDENFVERSDHEANHGENHAGDRVHGDDTSVLKPDETQISTAEMKEKSEHIDDNHEANHGEDGTEDNLDGNENCIVKPAKDHNDAQLDREDKGTGNRDVDKVNHSEADHSLEGGEKAAAAKAHFEDTDNCEDDGEATTDNSNRWKEEDATADAGGQAESEQASSSKVKEGDEEDEDELQDTTTRERGSEEMEEPTTEKQTPRVEGQRHEEESPKEEQPLTKTEKERSEREEKEDESTKGKRPKTEKAESDEEEEDESTKEEKQRPKTEEEKKLEKAQRLMQLRQVTDEERWDRVDRLSEMIKQKAMTSREKKGLASRDARPAHAAGVTGSRPLDKVQLKRDNDADRRDVIVLSDSEDENMGDNDTRTSDGIGESNTQDQGKQGVPQEDALADDETKKLKEEVEQLEAKLKSWTDSNGKSLKTAEVENIVHPLIAHLAASSGRATSALQSALHEGQLPNAFDCKDIADLLTRRATNVANNQVITSTVNGVSFQQRALDEGVEMKGKYARTMLRAALKNTELLQTANNSARNLGYRSAVAQEIGNMRRRLRRMQQQLSEKMERMRQTDEDRKKRAEGKGKLRAQRFLEKIGAADVAEKHTDASISVADQEAKRTQEEQPTPDEKREDEDSKGREEKMVVEDDPRRASKLPVASESLRGETENSLSMPSSPQLSGESISTTKTESGESNTLSQAPQVKRTYGTQKPKRAGDGSTNTSGEEHLDAIYSSATSAHSMPTPRESNIAHESASGEQESHMSLPTSSLVAEKSESTSSEAHGRTASTTPSSAAPALVVDGPKQHVAKDGSITKSVKQQPTLFGLFSGKNASSAETSANASESKPPKTSSTAFENFFLKKVSTGKEATDEPIGDQKPAESRETSKHEESEPEYTGEEDEENEGDNENGGDNEDEDDNEDDDESSSEKQYHESDKPRNSKYAEMIRKEMEKESTRKREQQEYKKALLAQGKTEEEIGELVEAEASEGEEEDDQVKQLSMIGNFTNSDEQQKAAQTAEEQKEEQEALGYNVDLSEALEGIVDDVSSDEEDDVDQAFVAELQRKLDEQQVKTVIRAVKEGHNKYRKKRRSTNNRARANLEKMEEAEDAFEEYDDEAAIEQREKQKRERGAEEYGARVSTEDKDLAADDEGLFDSESEDDGEERGNEEGSSAEDEEDDNDHFDVQTALQKAVQRCRQRAKGSSEQVEQQTESAEETEGHADATVFTRKRRRGACMFSYGEDLGKLRREESQTQNTPVSDHQYGSPLDSLLDSERNDGTMKLPAEEQEVAKHRRVGFCEEVKPAVPADGSTAMEGCQNASRVDAPRDATRDTGKQANTEEATSSISTSTSSQIHDQEPAGGSMLQQALRSVGVSAPQSGNLVYSDASAAEPTPIARASSAPPSFEENIGSESVLMSGFSDQPFNSESTMHGFGSFGHSATEGYSNDGHLQSNWDTWLNLDSLPDWDSHSKYAHLSLKRQNDGAVTNTSVQRSASGSASRGGRVSTKGARGFVFQKAKKDSSAKQSDPPTQESAPQTAPTTSRPKKPTNILGKRSNSMLLKAIGENKGYRGLIDANKKQKGDSSDGL